mmetsp:Transcript_14112/g.40250  ORF Transcript_14112/g.40250 Transcript_14112/m.40250 type:complete len:84 (-) Transcript_14112:286-537(-)
MVSQYPHASAETGDVGAVVSIHAVIAPKRIGTVLLLSVQHKDSRRVDHGRPATSIKNTRSRSTMRKIRFVAAVPESFNGLPWR